MFFKYSTLLAIIIYLNYRRKNVRFNALMKFFYSLYLTNSFGFRLRNVEDQMEIKRIRLEFSQAQLKSLKVSVKVENEDNLPKDGQYLVIVNHRGVIDPPITEVALKNTNIFGPWISKKELYNSFLFGLFVRNAGSILLDREKSQMSGFFAETKKAVARGESIFIFPEGTRNKTENTLASFKEGARIIALKNRLPILPIYIKTNASKTMKAALSDASLEQEVTVVIGDVIDYKDKTGLEENYKKAFSL
jgi:1-acyl-sn-glycerol-3-phosphate acyltransferase